MVLAVVFYFVLVTVVLALLLLPQARAQAVGLTQRLRSGGAQARRLAASGSQRSTRRIARAVVGASTRGTGWLIEHRGRLAWVAVLLAAASLTPLAVRDSITLEGFDEHSSREMNVQVAALLQGEQLVPPAPLPPELFTTAEIEAARPLVRGASRQWELLDAGFKQRLLVVFKLMHDRHGYDLVLLEGYRSPERQAQLAALGGHVTHAGAFESYHQYGLAADIAFLRDGRLVISERDPWAMAGYALYGAAARSSGLTWGGGWQSLKDYGHVELRRPGVLGQPS